MEESTEQPQLTPQQELDKLWSKKDSWENGRPVTIEGLPEGFRAIETDDEMLILRAQMPNLPEEFRGEPLLDVPIAVFNAKITNQRELLKEGIKFTTNVMEQNVQFKPPPDTAEEQAA